jgi:copper chaperone CopZ
MKTKLNVKGMHCASCEILIKDSLMEIKGMNSAEVSAPNGEVLVDFDKTKVSIDKIKYIIKKEGYVVE